MLLFTSKFALSLQTGLVVDVICCCSRHTENAVTEGQLLRRHLVLLMVHMRAASYFHLLCIKLVHLYPD